MAERDWHGRFAKGHKQYFFKDPGNWVSKVCTCGVSFETRKIIRCEVFNE